MAASRSSLAAQGAFRCIAYGGVLGLIGFLRFELPTPPVPASYDRLLIFPSEAGSPSLKPLFRGLNNSIDIAQ